MVTHQVLCSVLRDVLLPLLLAAPGTAAQFELQLKQRVDLIELNHFYDDLGRHSYDQIIFYEWAPDYRRYQVVAWFLVENNLARMPTYNHARRIYVVRWYDRDAKAYRVVQSKMFRETWSQKDPERANKKLIDEKHRISLLKPIRRGVHR